MTSKKPAVRAAVICTVLFLATLGLAQPVFAQSSGKSGNNSGHDSEERGSVHAGQFQDRQCSQCHTSKSWKPSTFKHKDYKYDDFELSGKHKALKCDDCHKPAADSGVIFYKAVKVNLCYSSGCHDVKERGNIHGVQFRRKPCGQCHTQSQWKPATFSHKNKSYEKYKLKGGHKNVQCGKCHTGTVKGYIRYRPIDTSNCGGGACHEDVHTGQIEKIVCEQCHVVSGWKKIGFDHNAGSRFKLEGAHALADCDNCHVEGRWKPLMSECVDCHEKEDAHKGKLGFNCEQCHDANSWKQFRFDHEIIGFKLEGAHNLLVCADCHKEKGVYGGIGKECVRCHVDPHFGQTGSFCGECHNSTHWFPELFQHNSTAFRLEGAHMLTSCEECHKNRFYRGTPLECDYCHSSLFTAPAAATSHAHGVRTCGDCHKTYSWIPARSFRHGFMTFSGAHKILEQECRGCHMPGSPVLKFPGAASERDCIACHAHDYSGIHGNGVPAGVTQCSDRCEICHTTVDFGALKGAFICD